MIVLSFSSLVYPQSQGDYRALEGIVVPKEGKAEATSGTAKLEKSTEPMRFDCPPTVSYQVLIRATSDGGWTSMDQVTSDNNVGTTLTDAGVFNNYMNCQYERTFSGIVEPSTLVLIPLP